MSTCYFCGGELREELTTFIYEEHGQVWIARNVPAFVCQQCGEKEYSPDVTHRLFELVKKKLTPVETISVPVYDLALVA